MDKETFLPKKYLFDFATTLTIGGILLYYLGWMYWEKYFLTLSIKPSFIDIPFDKIIVTTWFIVLLLILSFMYTFLQLYDNKKLKEIEVVDLAWFLLFPIYINIESKLDERYHWYIIGGVLIIYTTIKIFQRNAKIPRKYLSKGKSLMIALAAIYLFGIYFYRNKGEIDALAVKNAYREDITIKTQDKNIKRGKFIIYMGSKYFILVKNANSKKETIIINDSEVMEARFIN